MKDLMLKGYIAVNNTFHAAVEDEQGITAIEYAIIGVAMASGLYYIFSDGGFIESLSTSFNIMTTKILGAGSILGK